MVRESRCAFRGGLWEVETDFSPVRQRSGPDTGRFGNRRSLTHRQKARKAKDRGEKIRWRLRVKCSRGQVKQIRLIVE